MSKLWHLYYETKDEYMHYENEPDYIFYVDQTLHNLSSDYIFHTIYTCTFNQGLHMFTLYGGMVSKVEMYFSSSNV